MDENLNEREFFTLVDDEGQELEFELIGKAEMEGTTYYAMIPAEDSVEPEDGFCEYVILKGEMEGDEEMLISLEDDDEFETVAAYFDNLFSEEIDYDGEE